MSSLNTGRTDASVLRRSRAHRGHAGAYRRDVIVRDLDRFVTEHVTGQPAGARVPLVAFDVGEMAPEAITSLRHLSPQFAAVPPRITISGRALKHIDERRSTQSAVLSRIEDVVLSPDRVWPNPTRPNDPWSRPWLVKETGRGVAAIVEVAPNGSGIDVVNVIAPLGASRRKKVNRLLATLGPEGRKATDVAYTPQPQGAAAPSPASFPDLSPSADKLGDEKVFVNHLRIATPEDVHDAIQQIADARKGQIDAARRGVRSWDDTRQAAGERDAWADLMEQRAQRGEAIPTAERQLAMRELWISSADASMPRLRTCAPLRTA